MVVKPCLTILTKPSLNEFNKSKEKRVIKTSQEAYNPPMSDKEQVLKKRELTFSIIFDNLPLMAQSIAKRQSGE